MNGEYTDVISGNSTSLLIAQRLVDGLWVNVSDLKKCTLSATTSQNGTSKSLQYELCMSGLTKYKYAQVVNTYSRIRPVFSYPNTNSLCSDEFLTIEGFYKLEGGTTGADLLQLPSTGLEDYNDILICGYGGGDTIKGSTANDVLEAGDSGSSSENGASIDALDGSDRLLGGPGNDTLNGGVGDDVLIDGDGDDNLNGGAGDNQYLVGAGTNNITGGSGLDVVFLDQNKANVGGLSNCKRSNCSLTYSVEGTDSSVSATGVEVIIFRDGRFDITS